MNKPKLNQKTQQDTMSLASNIWDKYSISEETLEAANLSYEASQAAYEGTRTEQEVGSISFTESSIL